MDDTTANTLEHAIADLGGLLVQMDKFRARHAPAAVALRVTCLGVGDRARRAHRHGTLDPALAATLLHEATTARADLQAWLGTVRRGPTFQAARKALATPSSSDLATALAALFDDAHVEPPPAALHHPLEWQRRGRPRPIPELVDEVTRLQREGLSGESDPLTPGVDPDLPGVRFHRSAPAGEPVSLLYRAEARPAWVLGFGSSDDVVVPGARSRATFVVHLAEPDSLELDEWLDDPTAFLGALTTALAAAGIPLAPAPD